MAGGWEEDEDILAQLAWYFRAAQRGDPAGIPALSRAESLLGQTKGCGCRFQQLGIPVHRHCLNRVNEPSGRLLPRGAEPSPVHNVPSQASQTPALASCSSGTRRTWRVGKENYHLKNLLVPSRAPVTLLGLFKQVRGYFPTNWEPVPHTFPRHSGSLVLKWKQCSLPSGRHRYSVAKWWEVFLP